MLLAGEEHLQTANPEMVVTGAGVMPLTRFEAGEAVLWVGAGGTRSSVVSVLRKVTLFSVPVFLNLFHKGLYINTYFYIFPQVQES